MFDNSDVLCLTALINNKSIFYHTKDGDKEINLNSKYGSVIKYAWTNCNQIIVGYESGWVSIVSCGKYYYVMNQGDSNFASEVFASKNHKDSLSDLAVSKALNYYGTCGDGVIKIFDLSDPKVRILGSNYRILVIS